MPPSAVPLLRRRRGACRVVLRCARAHGRPLRPRQPPLARRAAAAGDAGDARPAQDFSRRRAGRRQDLRDADHGAGASAARASMSSSASSRPMAARETEALLAGSRSRAPPAGRLQGPLARRDGSRRHPRSAGPSSCWSTSWRTPTHPAAAIPSATTMSRSCSMPASTFTPRSTSSIVESLNDVVARITRIRVRETVPDSIIDRADEVEVVDLTPEDLIQRLKEGKVYVPHQAERAIRHYFLPGNLTALRELALRRTAAARRRADGHLYARPRHPGSVGGERARAGLRQRGPERAARWSAMPGASPTGCGRRGRRSMSRPRATQRLSEAERDRIAEALRLAQRLGGEAVTYPGDRRRRRHRRIRAGRTTSPISSSPSRGGRAGPSCCAARSRTSSSAAPATSASTSSPSSARGRVARPPGDSGGDRAAGSSRSTARPMAAARRWWRRRSASGSCCEQSLVGLERIALVFLTAVLGSAIAYGLWPSLFACLVSVLAYNFFFLPPLYTFTIADPENVVALFFFAVVAVIASNLTARVRSQALTARQRAQDDRRSLSLQPQARRGGDARRSAVGDRRTRSRSC